MVFVDNHGTTNAVVYDFTVDYCSNSQKEIG